MSTSTVKRAGTAVARYSYGGSGDSASVVLDTSNAVVEHTVGLLGGATMTERYSGDVWSYPNVHGDVTATTDGLGTKQGATLNYDPYGQSSATPDNSAGDFDDGWLGKHQRGLEHESGLATIEMGARPYVPGLARFLETDPVEAGSANDYDYVAGDPINGFDLDGTWVITCRGNALTLTIPAALVA